MNNTTVLALLAHVQHDLQDIMSCIEPSDTLTERMKIEVRLACVLGMVDRSLVIIMEEDASEGGAPLEKLPF